MKALILSLLVLCLMVWSGPAQASGLSFGPQLTLQTEDGDGTAGTFVSGYFGVRPDLVLELGYEGSGEVSNSMTRFGAHYAVLKSPGLDLTLGGGLAVRGLGEPLTENGGYFSLAVQTNRTEAVNYRFGVDVNADFSRAPKPTVTLKTGVVMAFNWPS